MVECSYCKRDVFSFRIDENTGKTILWNDNLGVIHYCDKNPFDVKKRNEEKLLKWKTKFDKDKKFDIPIYCPRCNIAYKPTAVCGHLLESGFLEGIDTIEFFSDNPKMVELRKQRLKEFLEKNKEKNKVLNNKDPQQKLQ